MSQHRTPKGNSAAKYHKQVSGAKPKTWAEKVLARKGFKFKAMSIVWRVRFQKWKDSGCDKMGSGIVCDGQIFLDPELSDEILLNVAAHEYLEILQRQMEWSITHAEICALGMAVSEIVR